LGFYEYAQSMAVLWATYARNANAIRKFNLTAHPKIKQVFIILTFLLANIFNLFYFSDLTLNLMCLNNN
jgi:hypothetical protein